MSGDASIDSPDGLKPSRQDRCITEVAEAREMVNEAIRTLGDPKLGLLKAKDAFVEYMGETKGGQAYDAFIQRFIDAGGAV